MPSSASLAPLSYAAIPGVDLSRSLFLFAEKRKQKQSEIERRKKTTGWSERRKIKKRREENRSERRERRTCSNRAVLRSPSATRAPPLHSHQFLLCATDRTTPSN
jgi:hypothetical protein